MILRAIFAFFIVFLLLPHQPDLGLPRIPLGVIEQAIIKLRAEMVSNASRVSLELRATGVSNDRRRHQQP